MFVRIKETSAILNWCIPLGSACEHTVTHTRAMPSTNIYTVRMIGTSSRNEMAPMEFYDFAPAFFVFRMRLFFRVIKVNSGREATENI